MARRERIYYILTELMPDNQKLVLDHIDELERTVDEAREAWEPLKGFVPGAETCRLNKVLSRGRRGQAQE